MAQKPLGEDGAGEAWFEKNGPKRIGRLADGVSYPPRQFWGPVAGPRSLGLGPAFSGEPESGGL
jgi:hypothetical protein